MRRFFLSITLIVLAGAAAATWWVYRDLHTAIRHSKNQEYIEIPIGSSPATVIKKLASEGIIKHELPLMLYVKLFGGASGIRAGEYRFPSPITPLGVFAKLRQGERRLDRFTVIEGWTRWDIANAMAKVPELKLNSPNEALKLMDNVKLVADMDPAAKNLEGYLYPDTYEYSPETTPEDLIETMVKRFRVIWKPEWTSKARAIGLTPRKAVITASLIETEAKLADERPVVASVIYNRLKKGIPLGVDSTVIYASKLEGKWRNDGKVYKSDVDRRSPYNTRIFAGLPPGPIASPGQSSLEAALNPASTDYLYYVREPSRDDGAHNFYNNDADFSRGVQALRNWEQQRDLNHGAGK